jgi:hypothetical protein
MKTSELFVVLKPSSATDSVGGDLPWQSYIHQMVDGESTDVNDAEVFTSVTLATAKCGYGFRVVTLAEAIRKAVTEGYERGEYDGAH